MLPAAMVNMCILAFTFLPSVLGNLVPGFRPPCVPLNVVSPYQSTWSCSDNLYDAWPQHWNGVTIGMTGFLKVDGSTYRFMGLANDVVPNSVKQIKVMVAPTTTTYTFEAGGVELDVSFATPSIGLDSDIVMASRPVTHVNFAARSTDSASHKVEIYYDNSAEGAVQKTNESVRWSRPGLSSRQHLQRESLAIMAIGTSEQKLLGQGSDTINWGHWLVSTPKMAPGVHTVMASSALLRQSFVDGSYQKQEDDTTGPRAANKDWPVLSVAWELGEVDGTRVERHLTLGYDQLLSQRYFGTDMEPLWRSRWTSAAAMLEDVELLRHQDMLAMSAFDRELVQKLSARGGDKFASLLSLAYRQVVGGTQAVWNPLANKSWVFMKEISSDGDVSTVDVLYPSLPMFQYLYPEYFRKMMEPLLAYGNNETKAYGMDMPYNLPWAPHHLGHWPICDLAPNRQEQMPVEESGNMLIMLAALNQAQGRLDYLDKYWPMLDSWADYIVKSLPDPANQLCTDDFEGPSPHNTNLAVKGIVALDAYSTLVATRGDAKKARLYRSKVVEFVSNWTTTAADSNHYRMQFNLPSSWSLKYNLLYQRALKLSSFPEYVFEKENAYYQTKMQKCGVPLDGRHPYTKSDWSLWTAALGNQEQMEAIIEGVYNFAHTTSSRAPLSDWYDVDSCEMKGFRARPVQGGLFAPMIVPEKEVFVV